ncbi:hypothetical protein Dda_3474 [Drechslerella dactyloides]|uniref:Uncharacterized protein n=1 Tax=Drechslerella dactyloides TaxID=74499 RepID=A0AAD6J5V8_DREDA|nr:hypothetical protein Dda_3474 [Drechslerella dactyloides]
MAFRHRFPLPPFELRGGIIISYRKSSLARADEIRLAEVRQYTLENSRDLLQLGQTLQSLIRSEETDYPIGWGNYDEERRAELQGYEAIDAQRQNRGTFELVQPLNLLELNQDTDDRLYELMQRIQDGYYDEDNEARRAPVPQVDPYEDPFADRQNAVATEPVGFVQPSPPLYFYTDRAKTNALISLQRFRKANEELLYFNVEVAENFYWGDARLEGELEFVWEYFWDLLLDIIVYLREGGVGQIHRWRLPAEMVNWIYLVRDVEADDDEPERPGWREYDRQGLIQLFTNFQLMHVQLVGVHRQWARAALGAFRPPILRDHPDIAPIYDLVRQQDQYVEFYISQLGMLRRALQRLPQMFPTLQVQDDEYDNM